MKKVPLPLTLSVVFLVVAALSPNAFATSASISASGTGEAIPPPANQDFTYSQQCDSQILWITRRCIQKVW